MKKVKNIFSINNNTDYILAGDLFSLFTTYSLNTLTTAFLLQDKLIYQIIALGCSIATFVSSFALSNYIEKNKDKFYNKRSIFFIIEGLINIILVPIILVFGNSSLFIIAITKILTQPLSTVQSVLNSVMMNKTFTQESRLHHDILLNKYSSLIKIIAIATGFAANILLTPTIAYAISVAAEVANNVFYMKQKPLGGDK